jgi:molybdopterin-guanine dinucleotide biosynthesis protein A
MYTDVLIGIVLSGGESRRMGRDKGLMPSTHGGTWTAAAGARLESLGLSWRVSVRTAQFGVYAAVFGAERLVIDDGSIGPLGGLVAAASVLPGAHFLLLACDMTEIDTALLHELLAAYHAQAAVDYIAFRSGDFAEPFPAIYKSVPAAESLQALLRRGPTLFLPVTRPGALVNRNYPKGL